MHLLLPQTHDALSINFDWPLSELLVRPVIRHSMLIAWYSVNNCTMQCFLVQVYLVMFYYTGNTTTGDMVSSASGSVTDPASTTVSASGSTGNTVNPDCGHPS